MTLTYNLIISTLMTNFLNIPGTLIDGEPIITLPPKSVNLKKVDFSLEERDFYTQLETASRSQFKVREVTCTNCAYLP